MSCGYTEESAIITSSHSLFPCDYSELSKKQSCWEMLEGDTVIGWLRLVLRFEITAGKSRELQACRQADLTEKLKA